MAIPAIVAAVAILTVVGIEARPFIPYWAAGDPWEHSHLVPDRTSAHIQVDLKAINADNINFLRHRLPPDTLPNGFIEALPDFTGRHASISLLPTGQWAIILDLRDISAAQQFVRQSADSRLQIRHDRLILSPGEATADLVQDYRQQANSYSLRDSRLYRHFVLNRPQPVPNQAGMFFVRWSALPPAISEEISLLAGCDPDEYLAGAFAAEPHYRVDATCATIAGAQSPRPLLTDSPPPPDADFFIQAAFPTDHQHIQEMVSISGLPILAQTYLLLEQLPTPPEASADPFHDDDALEPWTAGPSALDKLLQALDGSITATVRQGRFHAELPHSDPESIRSFRSALTYAGFSAEGLSFDSQQIRYEADLNDFALAQPEPLPPAPCPPGPRHVIIRSSLSSLITALPDAARNAPIAFCYTSEQREATTKLSLTISTERSQPPK